VSIFGNPELRQLKRTARAIHRDIRWNIRRGFGELVPEDLHFLDEITARIKELEQK
jgi:hypothetical protein